MRSPRMAAVAAAVCAVLVSPLLARAALLRPSGVIQTVAGTSAMTSGDLDGDGHLDLVVANAAASSVSIFRGDGRGHFRTRIDLRTGAGPFELAVGDMNRDGIADLAVGNEGAHTVELFLGMGGGVFEEARVASVAPYLRTLAFRPGPGGTDLLVMRDQAVDVFTLEADGQLVSTMYPFGAGFGEVLVGDFDGDHDLDLLGVGSVSMAVMRGRPDGGFDGREDLFWQSGGTEYLQFWWAAAGDMNGDGATDVAAGTYHHTQEFVDVGVWSRGSTPGERIKSPDLGLPVAVGDLDGDGDADMVAVKSHSTGCSVFLGDGQGGLTLEAEYPTGGRPFKAVIGDFDDDGRANLAVLNYESGTISLFDRRGPRAMAAPVPAAQSLQRDDGVPAITSIAPAPARVSEAARIAFRLPQSAEATIRVFDAAGRKVSERALGVLPEGAHSLEWSAPAPGVYFVRLTADRRVVGRTLAVIR